MSSQSGFSEPEFLASLRHYWPHFAVTRETDAAGQPGRPLLPAKLQANVFYRFDAESMTALRHAIEDLALEEANGTLLASFAGSDSLEPHRERYTHLAATVESVELIQPPPLPRRVPHARFLRDARGALSPYSLALYQGRRLQAVLIGHPAPQPRPSEVRTDDGFFSFDPRLIARVRHDVLALVAGRLPMLREFHRLRLVDQAAKQLKSEFAREEEALTVAMQRLLLDGEAYQSANFALDLERGLSRLNQWKTRLPELLAHAES